MAQAILDFEDSKRLGMTKSIALELKLLFASDRCNKANR